MILLIKQTSSETLQLLNEKINILESKIDSLQKIEDIKTLTIKMNEQANIVSSVNSFYDSAWLKLIIVISVLGVIIPILIQYFQRNNLRVVVEYLTKEMNLNFDTKIKELTNTNQTQNDILSAKIDKEINLLSENYSYISKENDAILFYYQGKLHLLNRKYDLALRDFCKSTNFWIASSKPKRAVVTLENISTSILGLETKINFDNACKQHEIDWEKFMNEMSVVSSKYGLEDTLNKIKNNIEKISRNTNDKK